MPFTRRDRLFQDAEAVPEVRLYGKMRMHRGLLSADLRVWKREPEIRRATPRRFVFAARTLRDRISESVALDITQTERSRKNVAIRELPAKISEMRRFDITSCTGCPTTFVLTGKSDSFNNVNYSLPIEN